MHLGKPKSQIGSLSQSLESARKNGERASSSATNGVADVAQLATEAAGDPPGNSACASQPVPQKIQTVCRKAQSFFVCWKRIAPRAVAGIIMSPAQKDRKSVV